MRAFFTSVTGLAIAALFGLLLVARVSATPSANPAALQASNQSNVAVELTALQETNDVRYTVTIINTSDQALPDLHALVALPPGATLLQALETDGFTHFAGSLPTTNGLDLAWTGNFNAGDYVDAFVFTLDQP